MATLENKNIDPILAAVANFCCLAFLGYVLIGQVTKGVFSFLLMMAVSIVMMVFSYLFAMITLGFGALLAIPVCLAVGLGLAVIITIDVYQVADAVKKGETVDENEYRFAPLYKILKLVHKDAILHGQAPQA